MNYQAMGAYPAGFGNLGHYDIVGQNPYAAAPYAPPGFDGVGRLPAQHDAHGRAMANWSAIGARLEQRHQERVGRAIENLIGAEDMTEKQASWWSQPGPLGLSHTAWVVAGAAAAGGLGYYLYKKSPKKRR